MFLNSFPSEVLTTFLHRKDTNKRANNNTLIKKACLQKQSVNYSQRVRVSSQLTAKIRISERIHKVFFDVFTASASIKEIYLKDKTNGNKEVWSEKSS